MSNSPDLNVIDADTDIYADLDIYADFDIYENSDVNLNEHTSDDLPTKETSPVFEQEVFNKFRERIKVQKHKSRVLRRNMASLYITGQNDLERKKNRIIQLEKEKYEAIRHRDDQKKRNSNYDRYRNTRKSQIPTHPANVASRINESNTTVENRTIKRVGNEIDTTEEEEERIKERNHRLKTDSRDSFDLIKSGCDKMASVFSPPAPPFSYANSPCSSVTSSPKSTAIRNDQQLINGSKLFDLFLNNTRFSSTTTPPNDLPLDEIQSHDDQMPQSTVANQYHCSNNNFINSLCRSDDLLSPIKETPDILKSKYNSENSFVSPECVKIARLSFDIIDDKIATIKSVRAKLTNNDVRRPDLPSEIMNNSLQNKVKKSCSPPKDKSVKSSSSLTSDNNVESRTNRISTNSIENSFKPYRNEVPAEVNNSSKKLDDGRATFVNGQRSKEKMKRDDFDKRSPTNKSERQRSRRPFPVERKSRTDRTPSNSSTHHPDDSFETYRNELAEVNSSKKLDERRETFFNSRHSSSSISSNSSSSRGEIERNNFDKRSMTDEIGQQYCRSFPIERKSRTNRTLSNSTHPDDSFETYRNELAEVDSSKKLDDTVVNSRHSIGDMKWNDLHNRSTTNEIEEQRCRSLSIGRNDRTNRTNPTNEPLFETHEKELREETDVNNDEFDDGRGTFIIVQNSIGEMEQDDFDKRKRKLFVYSTPASDRVTYCLKLLD